MEQEMLTPEAIMIVKMIGRFVLVGSILTFVFLADAMRKDKWH